ncbi:hypothetical protein D9619_004781 [Psilocybe cf. subviscida]|uniref:Major facilitator superfamily (MFS) profile domain-containing protein n=1 Tax=Psilocybe cf. subviscida TaxID=2480587 RepID=A0A8H5F7X7_9AGAR|nr:hypothetical protein D9619_004781 [Psilocybe cf. subviscida]
MSLVEHHPETHDRRQEPEDGNGCDHDYDLDEPPTPLPKLALLSVFLIQTAEPITATVIYPFINQFVRETGITNGDEKKTGYYAGFIESTFFFAESLTCVQWGMLSDRFGRRPVLLFGPLGVAMGTLMFGMSTTFWPLVFARTIQGIFNGNIGVSKSVIAELTDATNRGDAYAYMPLAWSFGTTTGPIIGGILANAAQQWPDTLGRLSYIRTHPYFLPCAVAGALAFSTFVIALFALKETLPAMVNEEKDNTPTEGTSLLGDCQNPNYGAQSSQCVAKAPPHSSSILSVLTGPLLMVFLNQIFLTFLDMSHNVLIPLMYSTSVSLGGLGLDPFHIGVILGGFGCVNSVIQAWYLGRFIRKCGAKKAYNIAFSSLFFCFLMYPITSYFARTAGGVDGYVATCIFVQLAFQTMIYMAYGAFQVILVEAVGEDGPMGTVNGVAQMLGSGMRSLAPTFASSLFSISLQKGYAGGNMVYYVYLAVVLVGIHCATFMPAKPKRTPRSRSGSRSPHQSYHA